MLYAATVAWPHNVDFEVQRPIARAILWFAVFGGGMLWLAQSALAVSPRPNIVIMLADDMGFGEVQCLNPQRGLISTPQLDAIAASGMIFTDAHSGSSVCTPTRYGLMTGRYAWRTHLQSGVLTGGPSLIAADRLTLAKMLSNAGYHTAVIGKWHLGMLFDGQQVSGEVAIGSRVTEGPLDRGGFDEFHGFHHARQIETWIDDDRVTHRMQPVDVLPRLTQASVDYIARRAQHPQPFFLYVPWSSPHSPVVPSAAWQGKSGLNPHADFVMQTDDSFGRVVQALKEHGLYDNTLIVCSSDNGTSAHSAQLEQLEALGHYPSANLRGAKSDIWDGGHRVPLIIACPHLVPAATRCDHLVCLTDILRTLADLLEIPLPDEAGEDSVSFLPALKGREVHARDTIIHHSLLGYFAIRQNQWKLSCCPDSGGWSTPQPTARGWDQLERQHRPHVQLCDMSTDIGEQQNLAAINPERVAALHRLLEEQIRLGRSTPGKPQSNDAAIVIDKRPPIDTGERVRGDQSESPAR